ncbi:Serine protease SPPA, chloroplastic [Glycine max]|nr:Serine protease SPPA, chloroplastic [Glycine max]KAH1254461.1 Serine protease SPPA, chloroplastic [Glycine max]
MSKLLLLPTPPLTTSIHRFNTSSSASALQFQCRFSLSLLSRLHHSPTSFRSLVRRTRDLPLRAFDSSSDANSEEKEEVKENEEGVDNRSGSRIADEDYPSGQFDFEPVTGWRSFLVKLKMLVAFPWERVQKGSVLTMKLRGQISDQVKSRFSPGLSLPQICENFLKAAYDPRISGIYLHIDSLNCGWGKVEEIRRHILDFKKSGKFVLAYVPLCQEKEYYLASACEEIYAPPSAYFSLFGLTVQASFLKGVLDNIGIEPQVERIGKYKSAGDQLARRTMSEENCEMLTTLLDNIYTNWLDKVSSAKGKTREDIENFINEGVYQVDKLKEEGLISNINYDDEITAMLKERLGVKSDKDLRMVDYRVLHWRPMDNFIQHYSMSGLKDTNRRWKIGWIAATTSIWKLRNDIIFNNQPFVISKLVDNTIFLSWSWMRGWEKDFTVPFHQWSSAMTVAFKKYSRVRKWTVGIPGGKELIAIIRASGSISRVESQFSVSSSGIIAEKFIEKIRTCSFPSESKKFKAAIIRIDSPGGDALASDLMWREIRLLAASKPVIASMSDVAASGGYYMAMGADVIVAESLTLTGSIGVVTGKFNLGKLYEKIGFNKEIISRGRYAELLAAEQRPFRPDEAELFAKSAQHAYKQFRDKAASSRSMTVEKMEEFAQGRVWTGKDAALRGLVDAIGGLSRAIAIAKMKADIPQDRQVTLVEISRASPSLPEILLGVGSSLVGADRTAKELLQGLTFSDGVQARMDGIKFQTLEEYPFGNPILSIIKDILSSL